MAFLLITNLEFFTRVFDISTCTLVEVRKDVCELKTFDRNGRGGATLKFINSLIFAK